MSLDPALVGPAALVGAVCALVSQYIRTWRVRAACCPPECTTEEGVWVGRLDFQRTHGSRTALICCSHTRVLGPVQRWLWGRVDHRRDQAVDGLLVHHVAMLFLKIDLGIFRRDGPLIDPQPRELPKKSDRPHHDIFYSATTTKPTSKPTSA